MAILEIDGLLGGKRLRRCSGEARWHYGYYLLLANGYARIELDFEAIAEHFVSFRDTAPTPESVRQDFAEYQKEHLVFEYSFSGRTWGQFDTKRSNLPRHKTSEDRRSPHPPEDKYQSWLKEYHGDNWRPLHWNERANECLKFLYILKAGGFYKIGISDDVDIRLKQLQSGSPSLITVVHKWPSPSAGKKERFLHKHFKDQRASGEWFSLSERDIAFIVGHMEQA